VKCQVLVVLDMVQHIDVALIHIKESIGREFHQLMEPSVPLMNGSI
jgi:hypothetical protein